MKSSIVLVAAFLCLIAFPTTTVGKNMRLWPRLVEGWPHPSETARNKLFMNTEFSYGDSKVWKCTYSNGSAPAISISPSTPSTPSTPSPSTPTPSHPTPKTSPPPPPTPSPPPPTPKTSPPPPTPSPPPPAPKTSPPQPTPSPPPPTPKTSPPPPTPSLPPPTPKKSPSPPPATPSLPPPTPKKSPSPSPPSDDDSSSPAQPSNPPPEHHHGHHHHQQQNPWEHYNSCWRNMGPTTKCHGEMQMSFFTKLFQVSDYCCNLVVNMKNDCDDYMWPFFADPYFVPLVRYTCHVSY
ncbi:unnamed protein product [Microthlaspi erraticum]|uniref:Prolamin-like domain-containing protein n=1 Tax=Microthlaspi erraticum TaxID=1685480 RepID=A0A6D2I2G8_9BRAS|nr:unnamed protein product [Microthlaspi erraticum]